MELTPKVSLRATNPAKATTNHANVAFLENAGRIADAAKRMNYVI